MTLDVGGIPMIQSGSSDGFGNGAGGLLGIILVIALLGGGGFGGFGGNRGAEAAVVDNTVWQSQQLSQIDNGIRGLGAGICDSTFSLNNSIKDGTYSTTMAVNDAKYQLGNGLCNSTFGITSAVTALGTQMQQCCCGIERSIDSVNFNAEKNTNAVIQAGNLNTQRLLDFMTCAELKQAESKIAEQAQLLSEARIISSMKPQAPIPAYIQANPYDSFRSNNCCGC